MTDSITSTIKILLKLKRLHSLNRYKNGHFKFKSFKMNPSLTLEFNWNIIDSIINMIEIHLNVATMQGWFATTSIKWIQRWTFQVQILQVESTWVWLRLLRFRPFRRVCCFRSIPDDWIRLFYEPSAVLFFIPPTLFDDNFISESLKSIKSSIPIDPVFLFHFISIFFFFIQPSTPFPTFH